jgi:ubiquinone/menaquinone biosynthesis C-methylase UbiE
MDKSNLIARIREIYAQGGNILEHLRMDGAEGNDPESIMISYEFQAGTYTRLAESNKEYLEAYTDAILQVLSPLQRFDSIMEVGVGEATLMNPLMDKLDPQGRLLKFGFDISWSRTRFAAQNSERHGNRIGLFVADLFQIPLPDDSVDVVYTSHSLEPNGGREKDALRELYRVARRHVVLLEPDYDHATEEGRRRMTKHGYVRDLARHAAELGYEVVEDRPFGVSVNPLNPTGLTVLRKDTAAAGKADYVCPVTRAPLDRYGDLFFCPVSGLIYPIVDGTPCLTGSNSVLGVHFADFQK